MSQPDLEPTSTPSVLSKKPQLNVYTVLLLVSLVSLLVAFLFLYLELREYGGWGAVRGRVAAVSTTLGDLPPSLWA